MKRSPYPTDAQAAAGARTARQPHNLEEQAQEATTMGKKGRTDHQADAQDDPETADQGAGEGTQPIPEEARAGFFARAKAAVTTGFCGYCNAPAQPDPRGHHECARCRRVPIPEYAEKREQERAAARAKRAEAAPKK